MTPGILNLSWDGLYSELVSFVYAKVKDKSTAEDIVQDVFVKVHTRSGQLREAEKISGWIYQITRNAIADHYRTSNKSLDPVNIDWENDQHELNDCVAHCLKVLMGTLPEKYRIPLELSELEDVSQYELADRLNLSYSGARSRVQRARKMLKDKLDELFHIRTDAYGNVITCEDRIPCRCDRKC